MEGLVGAALGVDVSELRKSTGGCVLVKFGESLDVGDIGSR